MLDEPEAALSVSGALALIAWSRRGPRGRAVRDRHPLAVLLACPGARIYELDERGIAECAYDDLDTVRFTRSFLEAPERFLRAALGDD